MDAIGVFSPEQAKLLWEDYQSRKQLQPRLTKNYPNRRPFEDVSPHRVFIKNTEAETIPPFGCVRVTGVEVVNNRTAITVEKPSSTEGEFLFNGPYEIKAVDTYTDQFGVGWAYRFGVVMMLGNVPSVAGAQYLPIVDSWEIEEGTGPFIVFGRHDVNERALIGRFNGGTGDGSKRIWFVIESVDCFEDGTKILGVTATWFTGGCTQPIPGEDSYGLIDIEDVCSILSFYTAEQLLGATGSATYFYPRNSYCEPAWLVDSICQTPQCS